MTLYNFYMQFFIRFLKENGIYQKYFNEFDASLKIIKEKFSYVSVLNSFEEYIKYLLEHESRYCIPFNLILIALPSSDFKNIRFWRHMTAMFRAQFLRVAIQSPLFNKKQIDYIIRQND